MKGRLLSLIVLLFLAGCINIHIDQTVYSDGSSDIELTYDMSAVMAMAESLNTSNDELGMQEEMCGNLTVEEGQQLVSCSFEDGVLTARIHMEETPGFESKSNFLSNSYKYAPTEVAGVSAMNTSELDLSDTAQAKALGVEFVYTITMPSAITSSSTGTIEGKTVTIDLLEDEVDTIVVESKQVKYLPIVIGVVLLIIIMIIIVSLLMRGKSQKPAKVAKPVTSSPPVKSKISEATPEIVDASSEVEAYVQELKDRGLSKDQIAERLRMGGYDENVIKRFVK